MQNNLFLFLLLDLESTLGFAFFCDCRVIEKAVQCCFSIKQNEEEMEEELLSDIHLAMLSHHFQIPH